MSYITKFAEGFMHLFQTGAETFISWMTGIVPVVLMLMVAMNTLIAFLGEERVTKVAKLSAKNPVTRYLVLPFLSAFMLGNPMSFTMARFLPEYYKPSYYAAQAQFCHTSNGVFPHINPGELFVWLGIAQGIDTLGLNGPSDSLYVCRDINEFYWRLGYRFHYRLCLQTTRNYP